jgi:hydrogenase expression/formation protein HypC
MCLAIPARIESISDDRLAGVDILGVKRQAALDLIPNAKIGDFILVHAGYGIEVINEQHALETLELIREFPELFELDGGQEGQDARQVAQSDGIQDAQAAQPPAVQAAQPPAVQTAQP